MNVQRIRRLVIWLSVCAGVAGLVGLFVFRSRGLSIPLWDWLLFTYGGMVSVVLPMDWVGKQATRFRGDADATRPRPRPAPSANPNQRVAPVEVRYIPMDDVTLDRVTPAEEAYLQTLIDLAVTELEALEDRRPERDPDGHVVNLSAGQLLCTQSVYPFFVSVRQQRCGSCIVRVDIQAGHAELLLFYVESGWRRRHVGRHAIGRLNGFLEMLMPSHALHVRVSSYNARARHFFTQLGFTQDGDGLVLSPHRLV